LVQIVPTNARCSTQPSHTTPAERQLLAKNLIDHALDEFLSMVTMASMKSNFSQRQGKKSESNEFCEAFKAPRCRKVSVVKRKTAKDLHSKANLVGVHVDLRQLLRYELAHLKATEASHNERVKDTPSLQSSPRDLLPSESSPPLCKSDVIANLSMRDLP
jgi:hypothetical protein